VSQIVQLIIANLKWGVALIAVIAVTSVLVTYKNNGKWEAKYAAYRDSAQAVATIWTDSMRREVSNALYEAETYRNVANIQTAQLQHLQAENTKMNMNNQELNYTLDSLIAIYGPINPIVCRMCLAVRDSLNRQIAGLKNQIIVFDHRDSTRLLEIDAGNRAFVIERQISDSLRAVIMVMPEPPKPARLFGIFRINSNQAFVAGAFAGIGSLLVLRR